MTAMEFWKKLKGYLEIEDEGHVRAIGEEVLEMLSARLTYEEAEDLKAQLPSELKTIWERREHEMHKWDSEELITHIQETCGIEDLFDAENAALSVFAALQEGITEGEAADVESQLPRDVKYMWDAAKQLKETQAGRF